MFLLETARPGHSTDSYSPRPRLALIVALTPGPSPMRGRGEIVQANGWRICVSIGYLCGLFWHKCLAKRIQHANHIVLDLIIGKTQDTKSKALKRSRALGVALSLGLMDAAIDLDDQLVLQAAEVDDKTINRMLTTEFMTVEAPSAQLLPEQRFADRQA